MNFLSDNVKNYQSIAFAETQPYMTVFCKSYGNVLIRVFLHAEFISAKQTEPKSMGFEKYAKNEIKNIYLYFLIFVIFSKSFKQKLIIPIGSCFLDGKKPNIAR